MATPSETCSECDGTGHVQAGTRMLRNLRDVLATATSQELATALDHIKVLERIANHYASHYAGHDSDVRDAAVEARAFYDEHRPSAKEDE